MKKTEAIDMLHHARSAHLQWRARAQALVAGIPLDKDQVPINYTDCKFGRWYYGTGQCLSAMPSFRAIEAPHQSLHLIYMKIFKELFGDDDRSGWSRLFGSSRKYKAEKAARAEAILPQLIGVSETLLATIDALEKDVNVLSDEDFARLG